MEREILDILKAFEDKKITIIETHTKICDLRSGIDNVLIKLLLESKEHYMIGGLRFNGVSEEKIKQVFAKYGVKWESPF